MRAIRRPGARSSLATGMAVLGMGLGIPLEAWAAEGGIFVQVGPAFGITDESFEGDYDDTIGGNARVGFVAEVLGAELMLEAMPESIAVRSANTRRSTENVYIVTLNMTVNYLEWDHFEVYGLAGIGLVTFTEILILAALTPDDPAPSTRESDVELDWQLRLGLGTRIPLYGPVYLYGEGAWSYGSGAFQRFSYLSWNAGVGLRF